MHYRNPSRLTRADLKQDLQEDLEKLLQQELEALYMY
jgi:hypothetical protein